MDPCLNRTCPHPAAVHDIYELGDPYPVCCVEGCRCGRPGTAVLRRVAADPGSPACQGVNDRVEVEHADPVIRVDLELWEQMGWPFDRPFALDTDGLFRYRYLRSVEGERCVIIGRVK